MGQIFLFKKCLYSIEIFDTIWLCANYLYWKIVEGSHSGVWLTCWTAISQLASSNSICIIHSLSDSWERYEAPGLQLPFFYESACSIKRHTKIDTPFDKESKLLFAQSAGAVEYTYCTSEEGVRPPPHDCPGYDTKQSNGEAPVMLELWGMRSTPSLPSPQVHLEAPDTVLSMG